METNHQRYFGSPEKVARTVIENQEGTDCITVWQKPEDDGAWICIADFDSREKFLAWLKELA